MSPFDRMRRPAKWAGYPLFALFVFGGSLYVSIPRDRVQDLLETDASAWIGAKVKADDFGLTLLTGPGVTAGTVTATTQPALPGEKPARFQASDVVVHFNLIALMRGFADTSWSGNLAGGSVSGHYRAVPDEGVLAVDASSVALGQIPMASSPGGVPLDGKLTLKADVTAPKNVIAQTNGSLSITLEDATVGDGKAQVSIPGMSEGLTVPKISLGKLSGTVAIEKGKAMLRDVRGHSKDLDVELEGYLELRDPLPLSIAHLYLKVKPSDALLAREPKIEGMTIMMQATAKRPDGYYGFTIAGVLSSLVPLPSKEPPFGVGTPQAGVARAPGAPPSLPSSVHIGPMPSLPPPPVIDVPPAPMPPPAAQTEATGGGPPPPGPSAAPP